MKLSPQTYRVWLKMKDGEWLSQEECFAQKITYRLSNKIREMEAKGWTFERDRVEPGRPDFKYRIKTIPQENRVVIENGKLILLIPTPIDSLQSGK